MEFFKTEEENEPLTEGEILYNDPVWDNIKGLNDEDDEPDDIYNFNAGLSKMVKADKVEHLTVRDKDELEAAFELYLPHFKEKLYAIYVINNRELWVCMLIKLGIAPIDIAVLLACTKSAVSKIRKRLYGKFFGQDGKPEGWDAFIHSL